MSAELALVGRGVDGRYRLEALLGRGALGAVYRARHLLIDRVVAIKILHPGRRGQAASRDSFLNEARTVNRVAHPNIAEIYDFGETDDGLAYLVMELLEGARLADLLVRGPVAPLLALSIAEQVSGALARAHDLGVIHRDLKPEHVFLVHRAGREDFVKLIDFGLAAWLSPESSEGARGLVGTPAYLSPEQARGEETTPQSDLYSLGVLLFEALTGTLPFASDDDSELLTCHREAIAPDPRLRLPGLDDEVAGMVNRLLMKRPADRFIDAYHLQDTCSGLIRRLRSTPAGDLDDTRPAGPMAALGGTPRLALSAVAAAALRASFFGRMLATAYPGGSAPPSLISDLNRHWQQVSELCQAEGELQVALRWEDTLHRRQRDLSEATGREIEAISRARSLVQREIASATQALPGLLAGAQQAGEELLRAREQASQAELDGDDERLREALANAGAAAARRQGALDSHERVLDKIRRWQLAAEQSADQRSRLQAQLERQSVRFQRDIEAARTAVATQGGAHQQLIETLTASAALLEDHFWRRSECAALFAEMSGLGLPPPVPGP